MIVRSMGALTAALALTLAAPLLLERSGLRRVEALAAGLPAQQAEIGINLDMVADWAPAWVFVDVFKHARPWIAQLPNSMSVWDTGTAIVTDRHGWPLLKPGQAAATLMLREIGGHYPGGVYTCFYEGKGALEFGMDAKLLESQPGQASLLVTPSQAGIFFKINQSDPADPIRNVRLVMPGFESSYEQQPFHPLFLERLSSFQTLRFMNWGRINETPLSSWKQRPTPRTYTQATTRGVAFEHMTQLVNQLDAHAWINIPHLADDEFVRNTARLWATQMEPGRKLYVEYSNEVWNSIFPQALWAEAQGVAQGLAGDSFQARLHFYAKRSTEVFQIFRQTFDALGGSKPELVCVLGAQYGNPWTSQVLLDFGTSSQHADALAIAPYFGIDLGSPANLWTVLAMGTEQIIDACRAEIEGPLAERIGQHAAIAASKGVELISYEGGQHLVGFSGMEFVPALTQKFVDANRHPGMYDLYTELVETWRQRGGQDFVAYSFCRTFGTYGSWGSLERQDQPTAQAHKYRALLDLAQSLALD